MYFILSHLFHLVTFHNKSKLEQLLSVVLDSKLFHWIKVIFVPCFVAGVVLYAFINEQKAFSSLWYAQNIFSEIFAWQLVYFSLSLLGLCLTTLLVMALLGLKKRTDEFPHPLIWKTINALGLVYGITIWVIAFIDISTMRQFLKRFDDDVVFLNLFWLLV